MHCSFVYDRFIRRSDVPCCAVVSSPSLGQCRIQKTQSALSCAGEFNLELLLLLSFTLVFVRIGEEDEKKKKTTSIGKYTSSVTPLFASSCRQKEEEQVNISTQTKKN